MATIIYYAQTALINLALHYDIIIGTTDILGNHCMDSYFKTSS